MLGLWARDATAGFCKEAGDPTPVLTLVGQTPSWLSHRQNFQGETNTVSEIQGEFCLMSVVCDTLSSISLFLLHCELNEDSTPYTQMLEHRSSPSETSGWLIPSHIWVVLAYKLRFRLLKMTCSNLEVQHKLFIIPEQNRVRNPSSFQTLHQVDVLQQTGKSALLSAGATHWLSVWWKLNVC